MTTEERELVMALVTQGLPQADFLSRFRGSRDGQRLCGDLLIEAIRSKDADEVEYALLVGYTFGFTDDHLASLLELANAPWHSMHEDVVTALGRLKSPRAVEELYAATQWIPQYLDYDESRALAVKAIWALGRIKGPEADAALSKLVNDPDPILAEAATGQIERRQVV